jgi:hypothetical protein
VRSLGRSGLEADARASSPAVPPCPDLSPPGPSPSLAIASPSLLSHRIPVFSPPRPDKVPAASCLCTGGRWSAPSGVGEGGRTRAAAGLRSEGPGTSPTGGARRRQARRGRGELKGIGAGKSRAPRRQASGYLVGGPPGHAEDRRCAESCRRGSRPVACRSVPRETYPKSRRQGEWARPTDERRARAREPLRPERPFA